MALTGRVDKITALRLHEEIVADNFSVIDCDIAFYSLIRGLMLRHDLQNVLDYGSGRNRYAQDFDPKTDSFLIRDLRDLRFNGAEVTAADIDPAVRSHPTSSRQHVIVPGESLPFEDGAFDLIVSDYVFEHVEDATGVARELERLVRPSGWIVVRTPNRYGYLKLAASLVPNQLHNAVLRYVQPHRKETDTFHTFYRLNSRKAFESHFRSCEVSMMSDSWEPAYFFGRSWVYRLFSFIHKILPKAFGTASIFILQKREPQ
jgi:SAM-dependent methyltransferase